MKKTIRLDNSLSTKVHGCDIANDKLLVVGFNFKGDPSYNYVALLDTNLNLIKYENLHNDFGNISIGGRTNYSFTSDGGALIAFSPPQYDSIAYILVKYDDELNKQWVLRPNNRFSRFNVKYIETDTSYFIFGETSSYEIDVDVDLVHQIYIDEVSKSGEFISHRILFEKAAFSNLGDAIIVDDKFVVSYLFSESFAPTPKFNSTNRVVIYDVSFNILDQWEDTGYGENLNIINDSYYLSTWYIDNHVLAHNEPHHIVRNLSSDLELEWTQEYLYPLFRDVPSVLGADNLIRKMWPDPRGGLYVVGDLIGPDNAFLENPPPFPGGDLKRGTSLIKINGDGEQQWVYKDNFDFINPMAAATLSSGNIIIVGEGLILDENGIQRETITAIKLDKDGCHVPGCRDDVSVLDEMQDQISITPNPSNGIFNVSYENLNLNKVKIVNSSGKEIYSIENPNSHFEIDISNHPHGIYIAIFLNSRNEILTKKLVKR
ncbi:MAG: T9SS type A sorting domain-containing protein [Saprospiraceae bacterium]